MADRSGELFLYKVNDSMLLLCVVKPMAGVRGAVVQGTWCILEQP